MKSFIKQIFATFFAIIFAVITMIIIVLIISFSGDDEAFVIKDDSVLKINFSLPIVERHDSEPFDDYNLPLLNNQKVLGLNEIIKAIKKASIDENIKGICLDLSSLETGWAITEEIRNELLIFKKSKKFIVAYGEYMSEGAYYLASVADEIYINPAGEIEFNGLASQQIFLKGTLDKLEIKPEIFKAGQFKSAVELFSNTEMSPSNKLQIKELLESFMKTQIQNVALQRKIDYKTLREISDSMKVQSLSDAIKFKLISGTKYWDEIETIISNKLKLSTNSKINWVSIKKYISSDNEVEESDNQVAVIYLEGDIVSGMGDENSIGSDFTIKQIRKAKQNKKIKAVVLRINSPGGSALASDVMWREIRILSKTKPVIASISDVAASGGYYLAMACDTIVAQPNSITGSIGVFAVSFKIKNFLKNKLGITTDFVATGKYSTLLSMIEEFKPEERKMIQKEIDRVYFDFVNKAAMGRNMQFEELEKVASGRVWTGEQALSNNLVDLLGGLDLSIDVAVKKAKIDSNYSIVYLPESKSKIEKIFFDWNEEVSTKWINNKLGEENAFYFKKLNDIKKYQGIQMRMPFEMKIY